MLRVCNEGLELSGFLSLEQVPQELAGVVTCQLGPLSLQYPVVPRQSLTRRTQVVTDDQSVP